METIKLRLKQMINGDYVEVLKPSTDLNNAFNDVLKFYSSLPKTRNIVFHPAFAEEAYTNLFSLYFRHSQMNVNVFRDMEIEYKFMELNDLEIQKQIAKLVIEDIINKGQMAYEFLLEAIKRMRMCDEFSVFIKLLNIMYN